VLEQLPPSGVIKFASLPPIEGSQLDYGNGAARMWVTDLPLPNPFEYWRLVNRELTSRTYCAVVFQIPVPGQAQWWRLRLLARSAKELDGCDALRLLREMRYEVDLEELAPGSGGAVDTRVSSNRSATEAGWLAFLEVPRPADIPFHLGLDPLYRGAPEMRSCLLRSWEERYGAFLFACSGSTMTVVVERPPRSMPIARLLAREHLIFSPTTFTWTSGGSLENVIEEVAGSLMGSVRWDFWWD